MRSVFLFIATLFNLAALAQPASIMLGPVSRHTATIWIQGNAPASVGLEVEQSGSTQALRKISAIALQPQNDHIARFTLDNLTAGADYRYRLVWNGKPLDPVYRFRTLPGWRNEGPAEFTVFLGSCAHLYDPETDGDKAWSGGLEIFDRIAAHAASEVRPNLMLWLGDNIYLRAGDYEHPAGMARRYQKVRSHPALRKLLPTLPHYAIWDDHDYGPNDHNQSFVFKEASLDLFKQYWPNPSAGIHDVPGIFTTFSIGDVDFFLLDNRWYRDSDRDKSDNKTMFGREQMRWLKNGLMASRARFKIIAGGSQFLNDLSRFEGWQHFREERRDFLSWLELNNVSGVLFLSGDRHRTELLKQERPGNYPLHELTCSPLTSGLHPVEEAEANHPSRINGTLVEARNYCTLSLQGQGDARTLVMKSHDAQGNPFWEHRIEAASLRRASVTSRPR